MKKVRYISKLNNKSYLTYDKVYDVIEYIPNYKHEHLDLVIILDDAGNPITWFLRMFEDFTAEYRNNIIDDILC